MAEVDSQLYLCVRAADYDKHLAAPLPSTHQILTICELKNIQPTVIHIDIHQKNMGSFLNFNTSGKLPALLYGNGQPYEVIDDAGDIVEFLDKRYPDPPLKSFCKAALNIQRRKFLSALRMLMKNKGMEEKAKNSLLEELQWLNITLKGKQKRFLEGDTIKLPDSYLLPLLHLIRVAGRVKGFEIPETLSRVWEYIRAAEETPAFANHMPSDDLIIKHWSSN